MKNLLLLSVLSIVFCISCSKKITNSPFTGSWNGGYYANNFYFGTWNIVIDNSGQITGKVISASGFSSMNFMWLGVFIRMILYHLQQI